jgi:NADH-quinone oxidoreductase subunit J
MSGLFHISSGIAILATFMAMISRHAVHALLYFVLSALALSLAIYDLGAPFAAILEVIIYAGAIMVLFVFVVMLLNPSRDLSRKSLILPGILGLVLLGELVAKASPYAKTIENKLASKHLLIALFQQYGTLVELTSFLLLAGLLAAYRIGKK